MSDKEKNVVVKDDDIQKALEVLSLIDEGDTLIKSIDTETAKHDNPEIDGIDQQIAELNAKKEQIQKSVKDNLGSSAKSFDADELMKSVRDELGSKFSSIATISKSILDSHEELINRNEELAAKNEELSKSLGEFKGKLDEISKAVSDMANNPINKLGSFTSVKSVERFPESKGNGKVLSLSKDKRVVLESLSKSLDSEDGQRRLGTVVGLIENGFIDQTNFIGIKKAVENELGGDINIVA